jgi:glycosyltransferase involved in cell wall biosynthesis
LRHIAHFIPYAGTAMGGPVLGMAAYVGLLAEAGYSVTVYSAARPIDGGSVRLDSRVTHVEGKGASWGGFRRSEKLWQQAQGAEIDLLHSYGLWTDVHRLAGAVARRRGLPHVLAPCGMLAPGALRRHWWKKVPARLWFQDRALREAQCLHAKSRQEYEHIRRFGLRNPVAIIPNPIAPPSEILKTEKLKAEIEHPSRRTILFLGRLHPVKGLERLVRAWARIQSEEGESRKQKAESRNLKPEGGGQGELKSRYWESRKQKLAQQTEGGGRGEFKSRNWESRKQKWVLVLAGPDEGGYRREVESLVAELGCADSVVLTGELDENQKWAALAAAELFVMPSDFENFGNAVVEAMSCGIPVITTTGTPWEELRTAGAGWWVEPRVAELTAALREALAMPDDQRRAMGQRAAGLAASFTPEHAGADLVQVYRWLLGELPRPACVRVE